MKIISSIILLSILPSLSLAYQLDTPEVTTRIKVSSTDINRIHCNDGLISDVHYSKEKHVEVETNGANSFVKFLIQKIGDKLTYVTQDNEMFVTCAGEVYPLILVPKKSISAKTIYLSNPIKNRIKDNIKEYYKLPLEEKIVKFSVALLTDDDVILQQYFVKDVKNPKWLYFNKHLRIIKIRSFNVEGVGLKVSEYNVISNVNIKVNPTQFLDVRLGENILGITLDPEFFKKNEISKIIIVEKAVDNGY